MLIRIEKINYIIGIGRPDEDADSSKQQVSTYKNSSIQITGIQIDNTPTIPKPFPSLSVHNFNMASSDSKSRIILPASQSLDVKPGSPMYVEGAETSVPVRRRPTTLRRVLLGLVFILVYVLLFKWPKFASVYPLIEEGEIEFVSSINSYTTRVNESELIMNDYRTTTMRIGTMTSLPICSCVTALREVNGPGNKAAMGEFSLMPAPHLISLSPPTTYSYSLEECCRVVPL